MIGSRTSGTSQPEPGNQRLRALVAYDGAGFHGFAVNEGVRTVAGSIETALGRVTGAEVPVTCAGRTDKGVHAVGQVLSFDVPADIRADDLQNSLNSMLGPEISFLEVGSAPGDFDARFSALRRTYRYRVLNAETPDPFLARTAWHVRGDLDAQAMNQAGRALVGRHDFSSFCRKRMVAVDGVEVEADLTREVHSLEWQPAADRVIELWISANAFCHQMVRSITGTLVDIGLGRRPVDSIPGVLAARDRNSAGQVAPAHGLTLWRVDYQ